MLITLEIIILLCYNVNMFIDIATVKVQAGNGGNGHLSFHRTKANAKGGPDGGDGGNGGDIVVLASHNTNTLAKYRSSKLWAAEAGEEGGGNKRHGKNGQSITLLVPPGTVISEDDKVLADLSSDGQTAIIAKGGAGGFGNQHFKSSVRQAPKMAELGEAGEIITLRFELKIVADVGLVGLPNAGKSTLLSVVSAAKPEIANYAFTTLVPNLGVVDIDNTTFLMADIPGLIEGASQGKGLGVEFLRHIERCRVLLQLIDSGSDDWYKDFITVREELKNYSVDLSSRKFLVVITKSESIPEASVKSKLKTFITQAKLKPNQIFVISSVTGVGLKELLRTTVELVETLKTTSKKIKKTDEMPVITLDPTEEWQVSKKGEHYVVTGPRLERFATRTNFDQPDAIRRLRDIFKRAGVFRELKKLGSEPGDTIVIAGKKLEW